MPQSHNHTTSRAKKRVFREIKDSITQPISYGCGLLVWSVYWFASPKQSEALPGFLCVRPYIHAMEELPSPLPIDPLPPDTLTQAKGERGETINSQASTGVRSGPQHPGSCCSGQSKRAAPPTASERQWSRSGWVWAWANCWEVSKGSTCRWRQQIPAAAFQKDPQEGSTCQHMEQGIPPECGKKTSFQKERWTSAWDTCKPAEHWAPQPLFYRGTGKSTECVSFNIQELQVQMQPGRCTQRPCSVCSILTHLPSGWYLDLTRFYDEVWASRDGRLIVLHFCS